MRLDETTPVVVVGGASGLGEAVARHLARRGAPVGILDLDEVRARTVAEEIGARSERVDVTAPADLTATLERIRGVHGQERVLVCCAGIAPAARTVSRGVPHDPALFARTVGVNLIGTFNAASISAAGMAGLEPLGSDGERGVILLTSSIAAFEGQIGQVAYAASKGGVAGMILPMARDLAGHGIRVMAIAPGVFATPMVTGFAQEVQDALAQGSEFPKRLGRPAEFAELAATIIANPMLNGSLIRLDAATRMKSK